MSQLELTFIIFGTIFILMSVLQIAKEHKKRKVCSDSVYAKVTEIKQKNSIEGKGYLKVFWYPVYTFRFKGEYFNAVTGKVPPIKEIILGSTSNSM